MGGLEGIDLEPYKDAAKTRRRSLYVYMSGGQVKSTIHLSMVPPGRQFIQVTKFGQSYRMAADA